jgi:DNA-binding CsgD family transcriptional regulator
VRLLDDSFLEAARLLESVLDDAAALPALRAQMLITLSFALFNGDETAPALSRAQEAVATAESANAPALLSQALSMRAMLGFLCGNGRDEEGMRLALGLDDPQAALPVVFRPRVHNALLLAWSGSLDEASDKMASIRHRCIDNGEEAELTFIDLHSVIIEAWRGNFVAAGRIAREAMERARQLDGDVPLSVAYTGLALVDAYEGRVLEARENINESLAAGKRSGAHRMGEWPVSLLGFVELSEGNYRAALSTLQPLLDKLGAAPNGTEIVAASFLPDAIEAMVQLGLLEDAEWRIELLEKNGRRMNRSWMSAVGGRCRGMLLAARGDVTAAIRAVEQALAEHEHVPMPFECARTQLLLGQLQRRLRRKGAAVTTLQEAVSTFERLNTTLWAERARSELARTEAVGVSQSDVLTPSERRVAELAASGMTNREVAAAIFISPKTVEFHLRNIYRKLDIHSRAELGRRVGPKTE